MLPLYQRLPPHVQARIHERFREAAGRSWKPEEARALDRDHFLALRVCLDGDVEVLEAVLDAGMPIDCVESPDAAANTNPLGMVCSRSPDPLPMVHLLLDRGASVNALSGNGVASINLSPMHDAVINAELLALFLARGGNPNLTTQDGYTLLDAWLSAMDRFRPVPERYVEGLHALDVLLAAGLDPCQPIYNDGSFLVECWLSELQPLIPKLIDRGFDPHQRGKGQGWLGKSLVQRLKRYPSNPVARAMRADIEARQLQQAIAPALGAAVPPRL